MAFVNRKFTEQEKVEIDQKKIRNFKENHLCYVDSFSVSMGTIDMDRKIYLLSLGKRREEIDEYFILITENLVVNVQLTRKIKIPDIIVWSMKKIENSSSSTTVPKVILELLKEALVEYRWNGFEEKINGPATVTFNF